MCINYLSDNPMNWSNILKQFVGKQFVSYCRRIVSGFVSIRRFSRASRLKNQYGIFFYWKQFPVIRFNTEFAVSIRCILSSVHIMMIFAIVLHHGYFHQKIHVWVSDKGINEWESPDGKIYDVWEFFVWFLWSISNNDESRRQKEKRESIWF